MRRAICWARIERGLKRRKLLLYCPRCRGDKAPYQRAVGAAREAAEAVAGVVGAGRRVG